MQISYRRTCVALLAMAFVASKSHAEQNNVLFILTDDQAFDAGHSLGWPEVETPNIDRLASQGVLFTHAYNQGSWTGAVCVASRTMLFTGQSLWHAYRDREVLQQRYVDTRKSWPQRMQAAGYRTCMTGKWHVSADVAKVFEEVRHVRPGMAGDSAKMYDRPHRGQTDPFNPADKSLGGYWAGGRHWSEVVADDAIAMLNSPDDDDRPFFMYVAFNAPHDPRQAPAKYGAMYPREKMSVPASFLPENPFAEAMGAGRDLRDERLAPFPRTPYAIRAHRAEYAAIISHLDAQIGRILDALSERGLVEKTRIVFTSDQGLAVGRHGLMGKQNMYDDSVRVPLVIAGPGIPVGTYVSQRVYMQDVVPTTLQWADAPSDGIDFQDLSHLISADVSRTRQPGSGAAYGAYLDRQRMITSGDWKLIVYPKANKVQLFNVRNDPEEIVDLADKEEHSQIVQQLLAALKRVQQELDDPFSEPLVAPAAQAGEPVADHSRQRTTEKRADSTFKSDVTFLREHVDTIVLRDSTGQAQLAVVPAYQGRVMTSTADGDSGTSFGWINYGQVTKGMDRGAQINVFGGEERFWLGPEGGQYSLFFSPGEEFEFTNWQTPPLIDTQPFDVVEQDASKVVFQAKAALQNYSKAKFQFTVTRSVELLARDVAAESLGVELDGISFVGYRSTNQLTNTGDVDWQKESGLLSIWLLGMYKPGPRTTVVIPYRPGSNEKVGPLVNDAYFGKVPEHRLKVTESEIFFSGDGKHRSKIGITPQRSTGICGSYDAERNVLSIVKYNQPGPEVTEYVNSMWEIQDQPYRGDAVNAYNDGPPEPGAKPLGPFYELETSSPALALKSGSSATHVQETYHFVGTKQELNRLSKELLGVSIGEITSALH